MSSSKSFDNPFNPFPIFLQLARSYSILWRPIFQYKQIGTMQTFPNNRDCLNFQSTCLLLEKVVNSFVPLWVSMSIIWFKSLSANYILSSICCLVLRLTPNQRYIQQQQYHKFQLISQQKFIQPCNQYQNPIVYYKIAQIPYLHLIQFKSITKDMFRYYEHITYLLFLLLSNLNIYGYKLYLQLIQLQVSQMASKDFNIKQTVNKNIEKNQFPSFANHRSMVGWCSMNYPKTLVNPIYIDKQKGVPDEKKYELESIFQKKNPTQREKVEFIKPLSNLQSKTQQKQRQLKQKQGKQSSPSKHPQNVKGTKTSSMTLATTSHNTKAKIFQENNKIAEQYSAVLPLSNILGQNNDKNFDRKVRQIGEVSYSPPHQNQEMRHLKKLPNTVIDQQNLMTILNPKLEYLDLQYKNDISNDLINKIGYLAPNIKQINLTGVPITNKVLVQLGKSCKFLQAINISKCDQLQQFAIISFLKDKPNLKKLYANHLTELTDACLECLKQNKQLHTLQINFCYQITAAGIQFLDGKEFEHLGLSSLPHLKHDDFAKLIHSSVNKLVYIDLSFNNIAEVNNSLMGKLGMCCRLQEIILTGCQKVTDQGINHLMIGQKGKVKNPQGLPNLRVLKLGGLNHVSDQLHHIFKKCPLIQFLQANNLERLTDSFLDHMKNYPGQRTILINFTPNITDQKIKDLKDNCKNIKIIRTISKMTDPADDGLRMPIPPASLKIKKPKKKKK